MAGPVAPFDNGDSSALLTKRAGIDFCPSGGTRQVGQPCPFTGGDGTPHACGAVNPAAILHCVNGKWAVERRCTNGRCKCTAGHGDRGDITCG
ncbi:uncharacterized protein N0V89_010096 [Didymosphaeria variabile]|uniref:Uncharacterized protein n=1 Tax=Didymosphaeria variabile TaxID=1932322 RepID=A0A9W9C7X2_9PLEO|nr:uncharacterized protein N0V89_010096 [Didymosphaeria variabile]KAJ4348718.1 hypothetical protein N0V89_010096 [Didymosphaeria variabile]